MTRHFDVDVRTTCYDVVDQPFAGTFVCKMLRLSYDFTQCPGMNPLGLALWKQADVFMDARSARRPRSTR